MLFFFPNWSCVPFATVQLASRAHIAYPHIRRASTFCWLQPLTANLLNRFPSKGSMREKNATGIEVGFLSLRSHNLWNHNLQS